MRRAAPRGWCPAMEIQASGRFSWRARVNRDPLLISPLGASQGGEQRCREWPPFLPCFRMGISMLSVEVCHPKMKMSAFTKVEMSGFLGCGDAKSRGNEVIPFIERPGCAPLRQSQVFSQTLVLGLAESLTLSSLR